MQIKISYDSSTKNAPAGFFTAVQAAVNYWDATITNPITLSMTFGYGSVDGQKIDADALAENIEEGYYFSYSDVASGLTSTALSAADHTAVGTLPASDPTNGGQFFVTAAEADVLGLVPSPNFTVGYIGLATGLPFTFDPDDRSVPGDYDAIGAIEHEISEVLGRIGTVGTFQFQGANVYDPLDLFRYASPGVRALTAGPGSFSIDGQTLLQPFNNPLNGGDVADWLPSIEGDSFGDGYPGIEGAVTPVDLTVMDILGYDIAGTSQGSLTGLERDYSVSISGGSVVVSGGPEGVSHTLSGLTSLQFADGTLSFDPNGAPAQVLRLWDAAVGRAPTIRKGQKWIQELDSGATTIAALANQIAGNPAFLAATAGMNHTQLIGYLYQTALGRAPTGAETATWTSFLAQGNSIGSLVLSISQLPAFMTLTAPTVASGLWAVDPAYESVEFMFQVALGRAPDPAELASWTAQVKAGLTIAHLAQDITETAEFQSDIANLTPSQVVNLLYQNALGAAPDAADAASGTDMLAGGGSVASLVLALQQDPVVQKHDQANIAPGVAFSQITPPGGSQLFSQTMAGMAGAAAAPAAANGHTLTGPNAGLGMTPVLARAPALFSREA